MNNFCNFKILIIIINIRFSNKYRFWITGNFPTRYLWMIRIGETRSIYGHKTPLIAVNLRMTGLISVNIEALILNNNNGNIKFSLRLKHCQNGTVNWIKSLKIPKIESTQLWDSCNIIINFIQQSVLGIY